MIKILRTQQLYIDLPTPGSEPWLNIIVQYVEMDDNYKPLNVVDRWGQVNVRVATVALNTYPNADPVPVPQGMISGAGIAQALTMAAIELIISKYGGTFDPATGYIILES
jgi:hypothetical protein